MNWNISIYFCFIYCSTYFYSLFTKDQMTTFYVPLTGSNSVSTAEEKRCTELLFISISVLLRKKLFSLSRSAFSDVQEFIKWNENQHFKKQFKKPKKMGYSNYKIHRWYEQSWLMERKKKKCLKIHLVLMILFIYILMYV